MICVDCPALPNGTRKRSICCKREGATLKVGDRVPMPKPMAVIRPYAPDLHNETSFKPARKPKRL